MLYRVLYQAETLQVEAANQYEAESKALKLLEIHPRSDESYKVHAYPTVFSTLPWAKAA